jgi:hypothetical protein
MKIHFTLIFILITSVVFSQNTNELDKKHGFKTFKFGQNKSEFKSITKEKYPNLLEYTATKYEELFDIYWNNLNFAFCDEKLYAITIDFDNSSEFKYDTLLENLEKIFGKSYSANFTQLKNGKWKRYNSWEDGKNVYMYIRFLDDNYERDKNCETCNIQLEIGNDSIEKECLKNDF